MQQTKRRSRKGVILLALAIALLVVAIVPGAAMAASQSKLTPVLDLTASTGEGDAGVLAQGNVVWFSAWQDVTGSYQAAMDGVLQTAWTGITVPANAGGGTLDVGRIVYKVDGKPANGFTTAAVDYPQPVNFSDTVAFSATPGLHTISSWLVETTATVKGLVSKPIVEDKFGIDNADPEWQHVTPADDGSFWNVPVKFHAYASDQYGSGVAPTPTASWTDPVTGDATSTAATQLAWDQYTWEVGGTVNVPTATAGFEPVTTDVQLYAEDFVGHYSYAYATVNFDLVAPHTSYTIVPAGADDQSGWTNKAVTVTFQAADGLPSPNSGVDYTEYVVKYGDTPSVPLFPALNDSGTKGTSVTVDQTSAFGPVYVYYRSVDKAKPAGNKEAWNLVMVFFDNVAPTLSDDAPDWWINNRDRGEGEVIITAADHNSGIAAPGVTWTINGLTQYSGTGYGPYVYVNLPWFGLGDGIHVLNYTATDKAGNTATGSADIKLDSRPPVTDGAAGWVNGNEPYVLTATDQNPGAGVAATVYRVDQAIPWSTNVAATVAPTLETSITLSGGQGATHTVDFASVDDSKPFYFEPSDTVPAWYSGNWELDILNLAKTGSIYKSRTVKLDVTAPEVTITGADDQWHSGAVALQFAATDVGAGVDYIESSTDGGATWTKGDSISVSKQGETTVTVRAVDKVGIVSATQTATVKVSTTAPKVTAFNASVKSGKRASVKFNVNAITPTAKVVVQIRTKAGKTVAHFNYTNVATKTNVTVRPLIKLKKGTYLIRVSATDMAGNTATKLGTAKLTVK